MKSYPVLLLIIAATSAVAAETGGDFWKNCPGPACPANSQYPTGELDKRSTSKDVEELSDRELKRMEVDRAPREAATKPVKTDRKNVAP